MTIDRKLARAMRNVPTTADIFQAFEGGLSTPLSADGSSRQFTRLDDGDGKTCICVMPPPGDKAGMAEAAAFFRIGKHLRERGVPVPEMYGHAPDSGLVICEDLGDMRLHDLLVAEGAVTEPLIALYEQVVRQLARMQTAGGDGFDDKWCWDTPCYDRRVMLERESGYFLRAFCREYLELNVRQNVIQGDFERLASEASRASSNFFLHRDFQSRNIMIQEGRAFFIDFQGGRRGPLGYDLASLLLDPYTALEKSMKKRLLSVYLEELARVCTYDEELFLKEYNLLAIQRNLQILGAFAFLTKVKGKPFFKQYIHPALVSLDDLLLEPAVEKFTNVHDLVRQCRDKLDSI